MRHTKKVLVSLILLISIITTSCVDDGSEILPLPPYLPNGSGNNVIPNNPIDNVIAAEYILWLESFGFPIYRGNTPPNINGVFLIDNHYIIESNLPEDQLQITMGGYNYGDFLYRFNNQDHKKNTIYMQAKSKNGTEIFDITYGNISGIDTNFTAYFIFNTILTKNGVTAKAKMASIISGTKKLGGIKYWYSANLILEKDDPHNIAVPARTIRILQDTDLMSLNYNGNWDTFKLPTDLSGTDTRSPILQYPSDALLNSLKGGN